MLKQYHTAPKHPRKYRINGKRVFVYWIMIVILLSLFVTATYTWFTISRTPRVSNIGLSINAPTGLVLSTAPEGAEWVRRLDYAELVDETSPLRPVTWSDADQCFYAAQYGVDGRQTGNWHQLSDENNANRDDVYGYYIKAPFYATTDTAVTVSLTHAVEVEEGVSGSGTYLIGTPEWDPNGIMHNDGGKGAQNAVRVGIRITPMQDGAELAGQSMFYIYEPNCDTHVDEELEGYEPTPSIDGAENLISEEWLIRQTTTTWTEADPVQHGVTYQTMGEFEGNLELFSLNTNEMVKIDLYIWLEGQDVDCDNRIGKEAKILANIQFDADVGGQSGLVPIYG